MLPIKPTNAGNGETSSSSDDVLGFDDVLQIGDNASAGGAAEFPSPSFYPTSAAEAPVGAAYAVGAARPVSAGADATGPAYTTVTENDGGKGGATFNLEFVNADNPTAAFEKGVEAAANILSADISNKITVNLTIGFGEDGGTPLGSTRGAIGGPSTGGFFGYATVRDDLIAEGDADAGALPLPSAQVAGQPAGTTWGSEQVAVWGAEEKALGLISATATGDDGAVGIGVGVPDDELVGVALHEMTHAMGRTPYAPGPDVFEFTRFSAPGVNVFDDVTATDDDLAPASYFSVDGGKTKLADYGQNSDPSDYANAASLGVGTPTSTLTPNDPFDQYYTATTVQGLTQVDLTQLEVLGFNTFAAVPTPCYARGTAIRTESGDRPVEQLEIGDRVVTASGDSYPIVWLGHCEVDLARHPEPAEVRPVRVAAGAFGAGLPYRDLWLSPGHSVVSEGALVPIKHLLNGRSVAQVDRPNVEYWHVELEAHDVLLAEGLPAESYLDAGNRTAFENGAAFFETHLEAPPHLRPQTCLPLVEAGAPVAAAKARLLARLQAQGFTLVSEAEPHVVADGLRIEPIRLAETRLAFAIPPDAKEIALRSRTFVPAQTLADSNDTRELGLCISWLQIDGEEVALDGDALGAEGWRAPEIANGKFLHRWTAGVTPMPAGARLIILDLAGDGLYWRDPRDNVVALSDWLGKKGGDRGG